MTNNKNKDSLQSCQTPVMVSADVKEKFAIRFMCWCEENKGWINNY